MKNLKYVIVGGDQRSAYLASFLINDNKDVKIIFGQNFKNIIDEKYLSLNWKDVIKNSDIIIFPLPISKDDNHLNVDIDEKIKLEGIVKEIGINKIVVGGGLTNKIRKIFEEKNINIIDYLNREELAILNAIPTAEGALEIAMNKLPITIYGSKCLVTGYGRVSKALINVLTALRAKVTVVARKYGDLAWAKIYGCETELINNLDFAVKDKDIIFNTVPYPIIDEHILSNIRKDCLIIELASKPGGFDLNKAEENNIQIEMALGLPGKVAPKTAGRIIKETIDNILAEI